MDKSAAPAAPNSDASGSAVPNDQSSDGRSLSSMAPSLRVSMLHAKKSAQPAAAASAAQDDTDDDNTPLIARSSTDAGPALAHHTPSMLAKAKRDRDKERLKHRSSGSGTAERPDASHDRRASSDLHDGAHTGDHGSSAVQTQSPASATRAGVTSSSTWSPPAATSHRHQAGAGAGPSSSACLLYTSDAADE